MTRRTSRTRSFRLEVVEVEHEFTEDEPASLSGIPAVDVEGEVLSESTRPLVKAGARFPWLKAAGGSR